jgi:fibronectin-binding autotransporter adhesin
MKRLTGNILVILAIFVLGYGAKAQTITLESRGLNSTWGTTYSGKNSAGTTVNFSTSSTKSSLSSGTQPGSFYGTTTTTSCVAANPLRWKVQPTLTQTGTWLVEYTHTGTTASGNLLVNIAQTNCTGLPANTTAFNSAVANTWETIGTMEATTTTPIIEFSYASGNALSSARWYLDTLRFTFIPSSPQRVWDGGGGDDNFSTAANWVDDVAPASSGDGINFSGSTRVNPSMEASYSVAGVRFYAGTSAFTITRPGSEVLTITGSITNNSSNLQTLNVPVTFDGIAPTIDSGTAGVTINGIVTSSALAKRGAGTLTLMNGDPNSLSGTLTIALGTVALANSDQIADTTTLDIQSGTTLQLVSGVTESAGSFAIGGTTAANVTGTVVLGQNAQLTVNPTASVGYSAVSITAPIPAGTVFTVGSSSNGEIRWTPSDMTNTFEKLVIAPGGRLRLAHGGNLWNGRDEQLGAIPASFMQDQITINGGQLGFNGGTITNKINVHPNRGMTISGFATNETLVPTVFPGKITGSGTLVHVGGTDLELQGLNDFTGGMRLGAGAVTLGHATAAGPGTIDFISSTACLKVGTSGLTITNHINLSFVTTNTFGGTNDFTLTADVNLGDTGSNPAINVTNATTTVTFTGALTNILGLTKLGAGTIVLTGANTYSGANSIEGGTVSIPSVSTLSGSSEVTFNGSTATLDAMETMTWPSSRPFIFTGAGGFSAAATKTLTVEPPISSSAALTIKGLGTVILNDVTGYSGALTVNGNLVVLHPLNITTLAGAGTIDLGANSISLNGTGNSTFSGSISGTGGMTKSGAGILTLSGSNAFTGDLTLNSARINFNSTNSTAAGTGTIIIDGVSTISSTVPGAILTNNIVLNSGAVVTIYATSGNGLDIQSYITGDGMLYRDNTGAGTTTISGSNDFSGGFQITARAIRLGHKKAIGTGTLTIGDLSVPGTAISLQGTANLSGSNAITNAVTVNQSFSMAGTNSMEFAGPITLANSVVVTASGTASSVPTFSGKISGTGFSLTKTNNATLTISNGDNDYDGGTTIYGPLKITNPSGSALGSGAVTVMPGGTLTGNGIASGTLTLSGTISPGTSPGTITTGGETWNGAASYKFEINDATGTAGSSTGWDLVNINGDLTIAATSGSQFNINVNGLDGLGNVGTTANFSRISSYDWVIAQCSGTINGFDPAAFNINTANFTTNMGLGSTFSVTTNEANNQIILQYRIVGTQFTSLQRSGNNLTLNGVGGTPSATYYVLASTNIAEPLANWIPIATNTFNGSGGFNYIHTINPADPELFYLLSVP